VNEKSPAYPTSRIRANVAVVSAETHSAALPPHSSQFNVPFAYPRPLSVDRVSHWSLCSALSSRSRPGAVSGTSAHCSERGAGAKLCLRRGGADGRAGQLRPTEREHGYYGCVFSSENQVSPVDPPEIRNYPTKSELHRFRCLNTRSRNRATPIE